MKKSKIKNSNLFCGIGKEIDSTRSMTSEDLSNSIKKVLEGRFVEEGIWLFGYGSLMWNPDFEMVEKISGEVQGYHRKLCLKSTVYRGTPDYHGLVFGLDIGYSCQGICFRIAPEKLKTELMKVWEREMFAETYIPKWIKVKTTQSYVSALTFVINNKHEHYLPNLDIKEVVERVVRAKGKRGSCEDYVKNTVNHLKKLGLRDKYLEKLLDFMKLP